MPDEVGEALGRRRLTATTLRPAVEAVVGPQAVTSLKLRPKQWATFFKFLDEFTEDGQLTQPDLERWLGHLAPVPRVLAEIADLL